MGPVSSGKASRINLLDFKSVPMRTFHITWFTFFLCFFGWFGIAPLMPVVREDLALTPSQVGNIIIGILGAVLGGWLLGMAGFAIGGGILGSISTAFIGAVVLLLIVRLVKRA